MMKKIISALFAINLLLFSVHADDADYYRQRGVEELKRAQFDKAIEFFKLSLNYNRRNPATFIYLASAYNQLKKYEEAIKYAKEAIAINGQAAEAYYLLGAAQISLKEYGAAKMNLERALRIFRDKKVDQGFYETRNLLNQIPKQ